MVKKHSMAKGRKLILINVLPTMGALVLLCAFMSVLLMCDQRRKVKTFKNGMPLIIGEDDGLLLISTLHRSVLY